MLLQLISEVIHVCHEYISFMNNIVTAISAHQHAAARFEQTFSTIQQHATMVMSKVRHMESIPIIMNHMLAHIDRYLMLLLRMCIQISRVY